MGILDFGYAYILRPMAAIAFSFYKVEVIGKENVLRDKGFILAVNHSSYFDGPFIAWVLFPRPVHWIVHKKIYEKWYFRPACIMSRSVPVNGSINIAEKILNQGKIIGIFPQGGICCGDEIIKKGHRGVAVLGCKTGIPIVPCYIEGTFDRTKKVSIAPKVFMPLELRFGKPLYFEKCLTEKVPDDVLEDTLAKIVDGINGLHGKG
ncbi:unnamed protein product [marine sediment metagenome]|uniref:Phospholipid/glycerol acyltransferase domain-containing protein n=1 Tax=marine sediment metagenome TaxID=412755 RepID=X0VGS5_9ZZZZ